MIFSGEYLVQIVTLPPSLVYITEPTEEVLLEVIQQLCEKTTPVLACVAVSEGCLCCLWKDWLLLVIIHMYLCFLGFLYLHFYKQMRMWLRDSLAQVWRVTGIGHS